MFRGLAFATVFLGAAVFNSAQVAAIRCIIGSIQETTAQMDAIFLGTITEVRQVRLPDSEMICGRDLDSTRCQAAIATVNVEKVWKGETETTTTVFSYDGARGNHRHDFRVGERMLFMLVRGADQTAWEYRPAICGTTIPEEEAEKAGLIAELDTLHVSSD